MSPSTPPIVTLASYLAGPSRTDPQQDGRVTPGELQSLHARLHQLIILAARLADTVERIRLRTLREQAAERNPAASSHERGSAPAE